MLSSKPSRAPWRTVGVFKAMTGSCFPMNGDRGIVFSRKASHCCSYCFAPITLPTSCSARYGRASIGTLEHFHGDRNSPLEFLEPISLSFVIGWAVVSFMATWLSAWCQFRQRLFGSGNEILGVSAVLSKSATSTFDSSDKTNWGRLLELTTCWA